MTNVVNRPQLEEFQMRQTIDRSGDQSKCSISRKFPDGSFSDWQRYKSGCSCYFNINLWKLKFTIFQQKQQQSGIQLPNDQQNLHKLVGAIPIYGDLSDDYLP